PLQNDGLGGSHEIYPPPPHDAPARGPHQAGNGVERRGLAGAIRAEQSDDLAARDTQRDIGDADEIAIAHFEMLDDEFGHCVCSACPSETYPPPSKGDGREGAALTGRRWLRPG